MNKKEILRRRDLLPLWVKFFIWCFMFILVILPVLLVISIMNSDISIGIFGIRSSTIFSVGGAVSFITFILFGIIAFSLWLEKDWAIKLAKIGAIFGIVFCLAMMFTHRNIRGELILLIPYLYVLNKIETQWKELPLIQKGKFIFTKKRKIILGVFFVFLVFTSIFAFYLSKKIAPYEALSNASEITINSFMGDLKSGNIQDAYSFVSKEKQKEISFDVFKNGLTGKDGTSAFIGLKSYVIYEHKTHMGQSPDKPSTDQVVLNLLWSSGGSSQLILNLVKEGNDWRVVSLK